MERIVNGQKRNEALTWSPAGWCIAFVVMACMVGKPPRARTTPGIIARKGTTIITPTHDLGLSDKLAAEAEHAEATRNAPLHYQQRRAANGQSVYGLRLPPDRIEQLRHIASSRGVEPSVLARAWLLDKLDSAEAGHDSAAVDKWEHDLRETTDRLREILDRRPDSGKASWRPGQRGHHRLQRTWYRTGRGPAEKTRCRVLPDQRAKPRAR